MKDMPGSAISYSFEGTVKEVICTTQNKKNVKKLFYQTLAMPLHELENKKPFKVCVRRTFGEKVQDSFWTLFKFL